MSKSFFYKVTYKDKKFYDSSHMMTPEKRWVRIQNDFLYKPEVLPSLLRSIFDEAKKDKTVPKFEIVKEAVAQPKEKPKIKEEKNQIEPKIKKEKKIKEIKPKKERKTAEQIKAKRREHYERNHEKLLQEKRDYHQANKEKIIAQKRQYRIDNKEQISLMKRQYYLKKKLKKKLEKQLAQSHLISSSDVGS